MAVNAGVYMYGLAMDSLGKGLIDFRSHTFMGMLCGPGYVPNQNTHQFKSSINNEITGSGYAKGGKQVAVSTTYAAKVFTVLGSNLVWPVASFTARYLVVYDDSASPDNNAKPLLCYVDFGENKIVDNQSFEWRWTSGIMYQTLLSS